MRHSMMTMIHVFLGLDTHPYKYSFFSFTFRKSFRMRNYLTKQQQLRAERRWIKSVFTRFIVSIFPSMFSSVCIYAITIWIFRPFFSTTILPTSNQNDNVFVCETVSMLSFFLPFETKKVKYAIFSVNISNMTMDTTTMRFFITLLY